LSAKTRTAELSRTGVESAVWLFCRQKIAGSFAAAQVLIASCHSPSDEPPSPGRNGERDFHGEKRANDTHESTTDPDAKLLRDASCNAAVTIVHLIHRRKDYFTQSKDYEFSRQSIEEHWQAGRDDVSHTFRHKAWQNRSKPTDAVKVFDLTRDVQD